MHASDNEGVVIVEVDTENESSSDCTCTANHWVGNSSSVSGSEKGKQLHYKCSNCIKFEKNVRADMNSLIILNQVELEIFESDNEMLRNQAKAY